jgi:hypothetical protein
MVETWNLFCTLRKYKEFETKITKIKIKNQAHKYPPTTKLLVKKTLKLRSFKPPYASSYKYIVIVELKHPQLWITNFIILS